MGERGRVRAFVALVVACTLAGTAAIVAAAGSGDVAVRGPAPEGRELAEAGRDGRAALVYRGSGKAAGRVVVAGLGDRPGAVAALRCDRIHVGAASGLCVARASGFAAGYEARVLGPDLAVRRVVPLAGTPSRARVSPDGRYGAVTMFVVGHSYLSAGAFATETTIIDLRAGAAVAQLEQFTTFRGERQVTAVDANYWGVTFARDSDRFFATLATGGRTSLVEGSVSRRTMRTLRDNVECPSLSPDDTRIAFKKRVRGAAGPWRLTVLDLATRRETAVGERRSVDDQAEWLDGDRLLYGLGDDVWVARSDGTGTPAAFRRRAGSPAVVRR